MSGWAGLIAGGDHEETLSGSLCPDFTETQNRLMRLHWALANIQNPQRVWYWQGLDGWLRNDHLRGKPYPNNLATQIEIFIKEDNLATQEAV
jgi:hypothetical protein